MCGACYYLLFRAKYQVRAMYQDRLHKLDYVGECELGSEPDFVIPKGLKEIGGLFITKVQLRNVIE